MQRSLLKGNFSIIDLYNQKIKWTKTFPFITIMIIIINIYSLVAPEGWFCSI